MNRKLFSVILGALLVSAFGLSVVIAQESSSKEGGTSNMMSPQAALGTAFTYRGRLTDNGSPADGSYDFEFKLYNAFNAGNQVGNSVAKDDIIVPAPLPTIATPIFRRY